MGDRVSLIHDFIYLTYLAPKIRKSRILLESDVSVLYGYVGKDMQSSPTIVSTKSKFMKEYATVYVNSVA